MSTDIRSRAFGGTADYRGVISRMNPGRINLPVVKTTTLSTTPLAIPDTLDTPWARIQADIPFQVPKDAYILDDSLYNWVGDMATTAIPQWTSFKGFNLMSFLDEDGNEIEGGADVNVTLSGWAAATYNAAAIDAYLSVNHSVAFTDGTTTIYKLETVQGSPLVNTTAV